MALTLSKAHAKQAMAKYEHLKTKLQNVRKQTEKATQKAVRSVEIGSAAFGMGLLQGRYQGVEVLGVPVELGLGIGLNVAGLMGAGGQHSDHLNNFGDGCLAAYATTLGRGVGTTMREKAEKADKEPVPPQVQGGSGGSIAAKGSHLSQAELMEMASINH